MPMRRRRNQDFDLILIRSWVPPLAAVLFATLAACSGSEDNGPAAAEAPPADGTVAGCRGSYEGHFSGNVTGAMTGSLDDSGNFTVNATTAGSGETATGTDVVQRNTEFAFAVGPYAIRGTFDLSSCTATGTWAEGFNRGDWSMSRVGG
jgi:hypothetical protein